MELIRDSLAALKLGVPLVHRNLALFPLLGERDQGPSYLLLDEALERKLARVTEISEDGSVPELAFENSSAEKILLVGARQNRIVNISILVGSGKKLVIPVSCVEQRRWSYSSRDCASANRSLFAKARAKKVVQVSQAMRSSGTRSADQHEIWSDVSDKLDAIETVNGKHLCPPEDAVRRFLDAICAAGAESFRALGEGEDIRLAGDGVAGGALAANGRVIHLAGFAAV